MFRFILLHRPPLPTPPFFDCIVILCKIGLGASENEVDNFFFVSIRQTHQTVLGHLEPGDCLAHKSENKFIIRIAQLYVLSHDAVMASNDGMNSE
jgi:hypothetical protein